MRLSGLAFLMLVCVTVVFSAAVKGQNEEFLNFLSEAFNRNSPEPVVTGPSNAVGVPEPKTVYSTSTSIEDFTDTADGKSNENSKSADQTEDYHHRHSKERNKLPETLELDNDSADSKSAERMFMDKYVSAETEKQPSISQEDRSQEMPGPWDSLIDRKRREQRVSQITETVATKMNSYLPDQLRANERNRKVKAIMRKKRDSLPLSDGQNIIDQSQECVEVSSWMMTYPDGENTNVNTGVDLQSKERVTKYERQPRKLCGAGQRLKTPRPESEQLDTDSA